MNVSRVNDFSALPHPERLGFAGLDSWTDFARAVYNFPVHRFMVHENGRPVGALALTEVKHPIFGRQLLTVPFASYGGFVFDSLSARDALLDAARQTLEATRAHFAVLRFADDGSTPPPGWIQHPVYFTYLIDLPSNPEYLLAKFSSNHRNHVRKSARQGFQVRFGYLDLLDDAYEALSLSMHELGSPYHSKFYLRTMAEYLGKSLEFAVLYDAKEKISGGGVFIDVGRTVSNLHANILHRFRSNYGGEYLYWAVIERAIQKGMTAFDLGRSLVGSGNETFKLKWNTQRKPLAYWH
ncbi:MAG: GNAT family N-acetyltransferase, partial [Chloroflexota bacterium]